MNVAVIGASRKPERYSYKTVKLLAEKDHTPFPVNPGIQDIDGIPVHKRLADIEEPIHTVTVYLSAENSNKVAGDILGIGTKRVIFNPGAENPGLAARLEKKGISVLNACTLVLLKTGQF